MENTYKTLFTNIGGVKMAAAMAAGTTLKITQAAVGDGAGAYYMPTHSQTELRGEQWRGDIATSEIDPQEPNIFKVRFFVPADVGGFFAREAALFDGDGNMIFVCNLPETKKEIYSSGSIGKLIVIMHVAVTHAEALDFVVNADLDTVTPEQMAAAIGSHDDSSTAHSDIWIAIGNIVESLPQDYYTKPQTDQLIFNSIHTHNVDENAHGDIRSGIAALESRTVVLEMIVGGGIATNPFSVTFVSLDGTNVSGVWNKTQGRIEF